MRYTLRVMKGAVQVFQAGYDDIDQAGLHVTEVAGKYPSSYTIKLFDGADEIRSEPGTNTDLEHQQKHGLTT